MQAYIIRRLLLIIPTLFLVTIIIFLSVRLIPGSIVDIMQAEMGGHGNIDRDAVEHALGFDVPVHIQYGRWIRDLIMHGDLGDSLWKKRPVTEEILNRVPITFELGLLGIMVALIIGLPIGLYSGIRQDNLGDYIGRTFAIVCIAVPGFWLGTMVLVYPSVWWGWTSPIEAIRFTENPSGNLAQFIIPGIILGMALSGITMRMTRTMVLEVLRQDYIRTAWAKGLTERVIIIRHVLKNALIPVVTIVGLYVPVMIGGAVVIEQIFCLPGMGRLMLEALNHRDYSIVSGINLVIAVVVLVNNLVIDLTYAYLDPRVHYK